MQQRSLRSVRSREPDDGYDRSMRMHRLGSTSNPAATMNGNVVVPGAASGRRHRGPEYRQNERQRSTGPPRICRLRLLMFLPMSDQPKSAGMTAAQSVRSCLLERNIRNMQKIEVSHRRADGSHGRVCDRRLKILHCDFIAHHVSPET
jgi:hypothetical protein